MTKYAGRTYKFNELDNIDDNLKHWRYSMTNNDRLRQYGIALEYDYNWDDDYSSDIWCIPDDYSMTTVRTSRSTSNMNHLGVMEGVFAVWDREQYASRGTCKQCDEGIHKDDNTYCSLEGLFRNMLTYVEDKYTKEKQDQFYETIGWHYKHRKEVK